MKTNKSCDFDSLKLHHQLGMKDKVGFLTFVVITACILGTGLTNRAINHGVNVCAQLPSSVSQDCLSISDKEAYNEFGSNFFLALLLSGAFWWVVGLVNE